MVRWRHMAARKAVAKPAKAAKSSFAALVKKIVGETLPAYRFLDTSGGSGPLVRFQRPAVGVVEHVVFQKGLHGADWFRVNLFASFTGPGALGPRELVLAEGDGSAPTSAGRATASSRPRCETRAPNWRRRRKRSSAPSRRPRLATRSSSASCSATMQPG